MPATARFPPDCVIEIPETSVRLPDQLMASVLMIEFDVMLPITRVSDVIWLISAWVRPKLPVDFEPRSTIASARGSRITVPLAVALTELLMVRFAASI